MARLKLKHGGRKRVNTKPKMHDRKVRIKDSGIFLPDNTQLVRMIAMKGAADDEIAETFGISPTQFERWRKAYPSMQKALDEGRSRIDADVTVRLYEATQGYKYEEEQATPKGGVVTIERYSRPDVDAMKYWLNNRRPDLWSNRNVHTGGRSADGRELPIGVKVETRNEIIEGILQLITPKPDGNTKPTSKP